MDLQVKALLAVAICITCQNAIAQPAQQNDISRPGGVASKARLTPKERQRALERYFVEACQKENSCDGDCKEVYD